MWPVLESVSCLDFFRGLFSPVFVVCRDLAVFPSNMCLRWAKKLLLEKEDEEERSLVSGQKAGVMHALLLGGACTTHPTFTHFIQRTTSIIILSPTDSDGPVRSSLACSSLSGCSPSPRAPHPLPCFAFAFTTP
jgi:hypothetical protein